MEFGVDEVFETAGMILFEHFDIRAVTLGVNLKDLVDRDAGRLAQDAHERLAGLGRRLVSEAGALSESMGLPIINKRLSITPAAWLIEACAQTDAPLRLAQALDQAACEAGVDFIGGFGALVQKGATAADRRIMESLPSVLGSTQRLCGFLNLASTLAGMNMDAIVRLGHILKDMACAAPKGLACAKFVAFCNAPEDNPFMAGAFHGGGEGDAALNVGISGPGVVRAVVDKHPEADLTALSEIIRRTVFKITRGGELVGRELARRLEVPFGVVDISLAPTTEMGDSVGRILEGMGLERVGAPGTTAALALLIDAVKKGGAMASGRVGGPLGHLHPGERG